MRVSLARLRAWRPKLDETIDDVARGALSYTTGQPIAVSRLDTPRGYFFVLDGHHRVVETILRGDRGIDAVVVYSHESRFKRLCLYTPARGEV